MHLSTNKVLLKYAQGPWIPRRTLGKTGLSVTQLGLGGESLLSMGGPGAMIPIATYYRLEDAGRYFPGARQRMETLDQAQKKGPNS